MASDLVKQGKDLVKAIEGQTTHAPDRIVSLCPSNQELVKKLVTALEKAEKRVIVLEEELTYWDGCYPFGRL